MKENVKNCFILRQRIEGILHSLNIDENNLNQIIKIINELITYNTDLELQNEELRRTRNELEKSKNKYADLYDFAPIGYFTLDKGGLIVDVNLAGANQLGIERIFLKKIPLIAFILKEHHEIFHSHKKSVFETREKKVCELNIIRSDNSVFYAHVESIPAKDIEGNLSFLRAAIVDISRFKEIGFSL